MEKPICPDCGSPLDIHVNTHGGESYLPGYHTIGRELPTRTFLADVAFCTGCEWALVLRRITL